MKNKYLKETAIILILIIALVLFGPIGIGALTAFSLNTKGLTFASLTMLIAFVIWGILFGLWCKDH